MKRVKQGNKGHTEPEEHSEALLMEILYHHPFSH